MEDTKKWWQSTGVLGSIVTVIAAAAGFAGYAITPADQLAMVDGAMKLGVLVTDAAAFVGGLVSLWGRIRATKMIG